MSKVDLSCRAGYGPQQVVRVQNPYLWGCYLLKKDECIQRKTCLVTEKLLFHVTSLSNIDSITKNNLDWRRSVQTVYGCGVSFSPSATFATFFCKKDVGSNFALIVARVLVGNSHEGVCGTVLPLPCYDTTVVIGNEVYVKYYDNEFYPEYVVYY
jgi:hypothetical protein